MGCGDLSTVGETGLEAGARLAVDHRHLMARAIEEVGRRNADHAGTEDEDSHGAAPYRPKHVPTSLVQGGRGGVMIGL